MNHIRSFILVASLSSLALQNTLAQVSELNTEPVNLDTFRVVATNDSYSAPDSVAATRINVALENLPINVQIITEQFIEDVVLTDMVDAMRYKGVNANRDIRFNSMFIRGFNNRILKRNGIRRDVNWGTANVDRIEIVKGPASLLYGEANPGGTVLYMTKAPIDQEFTEITFQLGSHDFQRTVLDKGGRISGNKNLLYRVVVEQLDQGDYYDLAWAKRWMVNPTATWTITPKLTLDLEYEYFWHKEHQVAYFLRGTQKVLNAEPLILENLPTPAPFNHREIVGFPELTDLFTRNGNASVPTRYQPNSPDNSIRLETHWFENTLKYRFDNEWVLRWKTAFELINRKSYEFGSNGNSDILSGGLLFTPDLRRTEGDDERLTTFVEATGPLKFLGTDNEAILGFEYRHDEIFRPRFDVSSPVIRNPLNGNPYPRRGNRYIVPLQDIYAIRFDDIPDLRNRTDRDPTILERSSLYAINQMTLPGDIWRFMGGIRYESGSNNSFSQGVRPQDEFDDLITQLGVVFKGIPGQSLFFNYSETYLPISSINPNGETFDPERGKGYELGVRSELFDGLISGMYSFWQNDRTDILQIDQARTDDFVNNPEGRRFNQQGGLWRVAGFDAEIYIKPSNNFQIQTTFSYIPYAKIIENANNPAQEGRRLRYVPEYAGSVFGRYAFENGLFLFSGLTWQTSTDWDDTGTAGPYKFEAWVNVDVGGGFRSEFNNIPFTLQATVQNVTDNEFTTVIRPQGRPEGYFIIFV